MSERLYRANFLPKLSATGLYAYMQKKSSFTIDGGYLPTFVPDANGELVYNLYIDPATKLPVMGKDGRPLSAQYAFMPDIELELGLRGVYSAGAMLEQPIYMGGKIRSAYRMATIGKEMSELNKAVYPCGGDYRGGRGLLAILAGGGIGDFCPEV